MSADGARITPLFGITAAAVGIVAGTGGVLVARAAFGPGTAPVGAALGLTVGIPVSLWSTSARRTRRARRRLPGGRRVRTRVHAVAWFGPVAGSILTVLAWSGVAHSSGSGLVQAIGALLAAVLATGIVAPAVPAHRARVRCISSPSDGSAGTPVGLEMEADRPVRIRPLDPPGADATASGRVRGARRVTVDVVPAHRGVLESVTVQIASSAPFGMVWWARDVTVALPRTLNVAPRPGTADPVPRGSDDTEGDALRRLASPSGETRGIRPYRQGDLRRTIHWPASAHTGTIMVNESEQPGGDPVVVEVTLPPDEAEAEREAGRMLAVVTAFLDRGIPVLLATREAGGPVTLPVTDRVSAGRRLARAVAAPAVPEGAGAERA